jgi:catechol 2,3-dioxygenase-like lactoylglutathione lyase family enzyme
MTDPFEILRLPVIPIEPRPQFAAALLRRLAGQADRTTTASASVRYFVDDLDTAVGFYTGVLDFEVELRPSSSFAMLYRGDLRLLLSVPSAAHQLPDGTTPRPGGSNRISVRVDDLEAAIETLHRRGIDTPVAIRAGVGVAVAILADPSGNPIELFEPRSGYHERHRDEPQQPERH